MPLAINLGFPVPEMDIISKIEIMPVTVPIKPRRGEIKTKVLMTERNWDIFCVIFEISSSRIFKANQLALSSLLDQLV